MANITPEDNAERIRRIEDAVIKINHFTESFPELMEVKLDGLRDSIKINRNLVLIVLTGLVSGVMGILFLVLRMAQNLP